MRPEKIPPGPPAELCAEAGRVMSNASKAAVNRLVLIGLVFIAFSPLGIGGSTPLMRTLDGFKVSAQAVAIQGA
jgi:hypothetical protein